LKEDAPVQKATKNLKELIGVDVGIEPEWQLLLAELDSSYSDKSTFVPSIAACVQAWCTALYALLEDGANEEWTDALLDRMNGLLRVFIEVFHNALPY
jgi:hypothetical protein